MRIGDGVRIGAFCIVEAGSQLEAGVELDHYCRIARGVRVGKRTRILYRAQIFDEVTAGQNCIIAGELVDSNDCRRQRDISRQHRARARERNQRLG